MTLSVSSITNIMNEIRGENLSVINLEEISDDLRSVMQNGMLANLKVLPRLMGQIGTGVLEVEDMTFAVKFNTPLPMPENGEAYTLPVKITGNAKLQIQNLPEAKNTQEFAATTTAVKMEVDVSKQLETIKLTPLRLSETLLPKIQELSLPQGTKEMIVNSLPKLDAAIVALGNKNSPDANILQPIYQTLNEITNNVQELPQLLGQLQQKIAELSGQKIGAEVTSRLNDTTFIKSELGNTIFNSPLKLATGEVLTLDINSPIYNASSSQESVNLLNDFFNLFAMKDNSTDNKAVVEAIKQRLGELLTPQEKSGVDLSQNVVAKMDIARDLLPKIPTFKEDFMVNLMNFSTAALKGDAEIWLGKDNVQRIVVQSEEPQKMMQILNDFVSSAVKETPLWRIIEVPVYAENKFSYVKLALPKEEKTKEQTTKQGTRFMVETQFSKLGSFQFDGFVQKQSRNLDLIVRTSKNLDDDFCTQIMNLFKTSLYNLNYVGNIKINRQESFININAGQAPRKGFYI